MRSSYIKDDQIVLQDICNRFIYEVFVFVHHKNIFSTINHKYFSSQVEIPNIIENYQIADYITVNCTMYTAPLRWLLDNNFELYIKPEKKKRISKKKENE